MATLLNSTQKKLAKKPKKALKLTELPPWVSRMDRETKDRLADWAKAIGKRVTQPTVAEILDIARRAWQDGYKAGLGQ